MLPRPLARATHTLIVLYGYTLLGLGCLSWSFACMLLNPVLPEVLARRVGRRIAMRGFRGYLWALGLTRGFRFDTRALDDLADAGPLIIAPNHPGLLDAPIVISRLPGVCCVMKASLVDSPLFGAPSRLARYIRNDSMLGMVLASVAELRAGRQLLLFPESTRTGGTPVGPFHATAAVLAARTGVPIQTVFIETDTRFLGKGWPITRVPEMPMHWRIRLGRRFEAPADVRAFTRTLRDYFVAELGAGTPAAQTEPDAAAEPLTASS